MLFGTATTQSVKADGGVDYGLECWFSSEEKKIATVVNSQIIHICGQICE